jgi:hypothetical protein
MSKHKKHPCVRGHSRTIHPSIKGAAKRACARLACSCEDYRSVPAGQIQKQPQFTPPSRAFVSHL